MPAHRIPSADSTDSTGPDRRTRILGAAKSMLVQHGLEGWSVERVAREAGCAKGLVHYHFTSRDQLLAAVAADLCLARLRQRLTALAVRGTAALDALWATMLAHAEDGTAAAWLQLGLQPGSAVRAALAPPPELVTALGRASGAAMEMPPLSDETARALLLVLDGLEAALVRDAPRADVRNAYDRVWLALLD